LLDAGRVASLPCSLDWELAQLKPAVQILRLDMDPAEGVEKPRDVCVIADFLGPCQSVSRRIRA
jgi:hypothetical protein